MVKVRTKTSKRVTLRKKYSVQKKVADHKRKLKKEIRKMRKGGLATQKPSLKKIGLPNLYPFKNRVLDEAEEAELLEAEAKANKKSVDKANQLLPGGVLENFAAETSGKLVQLEEKKNELTTEEIKEAERLMNLTGEIQSTTQNSK